MILSLIIFWTLLPIGIFSQQFSKLDFFKPAIREKQYCGKTI